MIRNIFLFVCCLTVVGSGLRAQRSVLTVELPLSTHGLEVPVRVNLDGKDVGNDSSLALFEITGHERLPVACQVEHSDHRWLNWIAKDPGDKRDKLVYELVSGAPPRTLARAVPDGYKPSAIVAIKDDSSLTIENGRQQLLRYWFATVNPPAGVDSHFRRSGFIHPLWTPHGQALTRIQPPDHRHHYGLWNPWTHALFENDTVDFWNLGSKLGFVRFAKFLSVTDGPVFSEFKVLHEHVVLKKDGSQKVAINEIQTVRVYRPADSADHYYLDITSQLSCASASPVLLLTYRYGGLGWRATEVWNRNNSEVLTSEGKDRKTADGSKARWCIVEGSLDSLGPDRYGDYGGAVMLSDPSNYNHPEPLRIWPENSNGRGDLFANFDPTKDKDWLLEPGKTYTLHYRLVVFNGKFSKERAESAWDYFAAPPAVNYRGR